MTLRKFYGHHHELVDRYDVSVSKIVKTFYLVLDYGLPFTSSSLLCTEHDLFLNMTVLLSVNSHCYKTCHGTCLSNIHVFDYDSVFVIRIGYCYSVYSLNIFFLIIYSYIKKR